MKTWLYLPLLLLGFILPGCTKKTTEIVIPNQTVLYEITPDAWGYDNNTGTYFYSIPLPELKGVNQTDGVIVSMARYNASGQTPQAYELLPQVYNNQSYFIIHDDANLEVDIKGINGAASVKPATKVRVKIVLIPSVN